TFRRLDLVCVPEREDIDRWAVLGVPRDRIRVTGSIKYDPDVQAESQAVAAPLWDASSVGASDGAVLFGGSTHRGEEEIFATVVFVGKSLTTHGGQNPVEPILAGKPVVFGPHMENFSMLARTLVSRKAAIQVRDADSLEQAIAELLQDTEARQRLVQNALEV